MTGETVETETPAMRATSANIVGTDSPAMRRLLEHLRMVSLPAMALFSTTNRQQADNCNWNLIVRLSKRLRNRFSMAFFDKMNIFLYREIYKIRVSMAAGRVGAFKFPNRPESDVCGAWGSRHPHQLMATASTISTAAKRGAVYRPAMPFNATSGHHRD